MRFSVWHVHTRGTSDKVLLQKSRTVFLFHPCIVSRIPNDVSPQLSRFPGLMKTPTNSSALTGYEAHSGDGNILREWFYQCFSSPAFHLRSKLSSIPPGLNFWANIFRISWLNSSKNIFNGGAFLFETWTVARAFFYKFLLVHVRNRIWMKTDTNSRMRVVKYYARLVPRKSSSICDKR